MWLWGHLKTTRTLKSVSHVFFFFHFFSLSPQKSEMVRRKYESQCPVGNNQTPSGHPLLDGQSELQRGQCNLKNTGQKLLVKPGADICCELF